MNRYSHISYHGERCTKYSRLLVVLIYRLLSTHWNYQTMMNQDSELGINGFNQICRGCGRTFAHLTGFSNHFASCGPKKKRLANALLSAQELYREKKRRRLLQGQEAVGMGPLTTSHQDSVVCSGGASTYYVCLYTICSASPFLPSSIGFWCL